MIFLRFFRLPPDMSPELRANIRRYYLDISWWGLYAGATAAFLTIYAARIGATPAQIGLLSALPSAASLMLSLPFAGLVQRLGPHRSTWLGALGGRLPLVVYALLPFFLPHVTQVSALIVIALLLAVPNTLVGISFPQLLMEAVPPDWRGTVVGVRNALFSIITFVITMLTGQILTRVPFPAGYQLVFVIGFIGAVMTAYQLYHVKPLTGPRLTAPGLLASPRRFFPALNPAGRGYIRVIGLLFFFNMTNNMLTPLVPEVLVHRLRLSDAWISLGTAASNLIIFLISLMIARIVRRTGNRGATAVGAVFLALQSVMLALAVTPAGYLFSALLAGLGAGVLNTAQFNYHLENVPELDRSVWLSWNLLLGNAALLIGALVGPQIAGLTGLPTALVIFGGLRLLMALLIFRLG